MSKQKLSLYAKFTQKASALGVAILVVGATIAPLLLSSNASALQMGSRSLTISSAKPSNTNVQYTFSFVLATLTGTSDVEGIKIEACNTAVGTCSGTAGTDIPDVSGASFVSQNANWQGATNFAVDGTGANNCTPSTTVICLNRTDTTNQTTNTARIITLNGINNPSAANNTFFMRITTFDNNTYSSSGGANNLQLDKGTVAASTVQTLTVNAAVAEVLNFCAGETTTDTGATDAGIPADCSGISGTTVNIGTLDTSQINVSPVSTNGGNSRNGLLMLRTNAASGATVSYDAILDSGTGQLGTLRIGGATDCAGDTLTDSCIRAQGGTQGVFSAGAEKFGMTIGAVNCSSTTSYACTFAGNDYHLTRDSNYDGNGTNTYTTDSGTVAGPTNQGYAWVDSGASTQIASSTQPVDDESLILKFASTPAITTPFGSYAVQTDFIAVPTY